MLRQASIYPTVVHCSAGIGRTGVLILMETALYMIEANQPVYPLDLIKAMRDQVIIIRQIKKMMVRYCKNLIIRLCAASPASDIMSLSGSNLKTKTFKNLSILHDFSELA